MALLHALTQQGQRGAQWELGAPAAAAGIPPLPDLKLPDLPAMIGGCDLTALAASLGPTVAAALTAQFADPAVQSLMTGDLSAKRTQLLAYLDSLDRQKDGLLAQITATTGVSGALGVAQDTLSGVRRALGAATDSPLGSGILAAVGEACPAAAGLLTYAENTLDTIGSDLAGTESFLTGLTSQLTSLTSLRGLAEDLLAELDAHIEILPTLLASLGGP